MVTSYILSLAVCIPLSGWLTEHYGSRRVFLVALVTFLRSSIACGLAVNAGMLIAARVPQGISAAMMMPVGRMAIVRTFPKGELLRAMNFVIIPALLGPLLGPTVGGLTVHWLSWRDIFFVNVPVGLVALRFGHKYMPDYRSESPQPLDVRGLLLFVSGAGLLSWLLKIFGDHELGNGQALALLVVSVSLLASMASTMASTMQQMSMSFGLFLGSLITGFFLADMPQTDQHAVTGALHHAFLTLLSALSFRSLLDNDGETVSRGIG